MARVGAGSLGGSGEITSRIFEDITSQLLLCVLVYWLLRFARPSLRDYQLKPNLIWVALLLAWPLQIMLAGVHRLLLRIFPLEKVLSESMEKLLNPTSTSHWILLILSVVFVAPICEEFVFRGQIFNRLRSKSDMVAILITSVAFSVAHMHPAFIGYAFIAGIIFGMLRLRYSLAFTTMLHACFNATGLAVHFSFGEKRDMLGSPSIIVISIVVSIVGLAWLWKRTSVKVSI